MSYDNAGNLETDTYTGAGTRTYDAENRVKAKVLLNVLSIALKPEDFQANRADLIKLRDLALWQNTRSAKARVKLKSVVEDFHDFAVKD